MARKRRMAPLSPEEIPTVEAWGRRIAEEPEKLKENMRSVLERATGAKKAQL